MNLKLQPITYNLQPRKGFTLIELLVVMTITALIATVSLANYRAGEIRKRVGLASDSVVSALGLAQTYALAGKATTNSVASCRTPQYYFIKFNLLASNYTLFALNNCSTTDTIQTFQLPTNTTISALVLDGTNTASNLNIAIYPPFGQIKALLGAAATYNSFNTSLITVKSSDGSVTKTVSVDGVVGRIGQ